MHIHILGICGTFMGGIALLARQAGHEVSGSDSNVYPPMSTQLQAQGITLMEGYDPAHLNPAPDMVVIGNALSRGNPAVEYVLSNNLAYTSGPQWLAEHFLNNRWVLAVAGTHGKTTTSSLLAWILEDAGLNPGFLIGGVPENFGVSARAGDAPFFVIEADEYDTAFFDKRSKFVHYHPRTLVLNNLEFDHADIFDDLTAIQKQFHHLMRTVPGNGLVVHNADEAAIEEVIKMGCWTPREGFSTGQNAVWGIDSPNPVTNEFNVLLEGQDVGRTGVSLPGGHNRMNALAAIAAARHAGVPVAIALDALGRFQGIKRRMELRGEVGGIRIYDDFAHHPTAIEQTLQGLRHQVGNQRILAVLEPRSNTMRMGIHREQLAPSLDVADKVFLFQPADAEWALEDVSNSIGDRAHCYSDMDELVVAIHEQARADDHILVMSNGGFGNIHQRLLEELA
ncbi:MAG: UDP-N-acetylmuramate:L-alanyl-gamma-D-glutamyl-meso-diaminopimelate ligase [Gammaproteobacteria bacterium]|nr:UDP-N-acetylmuramate:L-alanyl-gamma-D-glutamyl-meso-diaminopimelate ligase [Gammaproteobacteria bacterium]